MGHGPRFRPLRPGFMASAMLVALVLTPAVGWLAENLVDERAARAAAIEEADRSLRAEMLELGFAPVESETAASLAATRGIELLAARTEFSLPLEGGVVRGRSPGADETRTARVVAAELSRYPREFLERARLSRVLLVSGLSEANRPIPSLPNVHRSLLLDVDADDAFLRRLVHHELYHFFDYAGDDQVQSDPEWERLNDRWFVYGSGGRFERNPASSARADIPGFVTRYAKSALEEDKAETFAFWVVDRDWLEGRAKTDPVLAAKLAAIRGELERAGLPSTVGAPSIRPSHSLRSVRARAILAPALTPPR